ncbi:hypothetical protein EVAR_94080_1 [Eumeta japonica]|uniref:Uncharacterized protein n=1 Tax=Eumeta variegata TaxID=151549 RepID=A0A4C1V711_EUMVA|nr:hypothetical protein EVAR_94080_1 [Eumeta japonica]
MIDGAPGTDDAPPGARVGRGCRRQFESPLTDKKDQDRKCVNIVNEIGSETAVRFRVQAASAMKVRHRFGTVVVGLPAQRSEQGTLLTEVPLKLRLCLLWR